MNDLASLPQVLSMKQVCQYLQANRQTVIKDLIRTGKLRYFMLAGRYKITREALEEFLKVGTPAEDCGVAECPVHHGGNAPYCLAEETRAANWAKANVTHYGPREGKA